MTGSKLDLIFQQIIEEEYDSIFYGTPNKNTEKELIFSALVGIPGAGK